MVLLGNQNDYNAHPTAWSLQWHSYYVTLRSFPPLRSYGSAHVFFKHRNYVILFSKRTYMQTWYTDELELLYLPGFGLAVLLLAWWTTSFCQVTLTCLCGLSPRFLLLTSTPVFSPLFVWCLPYLAWVLTPQPHIPRQKHWLATVPSPKEWFQLLTKICVNKVATWLHQTYFRHTYLLSLSTFP